MKIAITGASGHLGSCLVEQLIDKGFQLKLLVHQSKNSEWEVPGIELFKGDLLDKPSLISFSKNVDVIFHLAAQIAINNKHSNLVKDINITGTRNILDAAIENGVKRFIHFSSIHAHHTDPRNEELNESRPLIRSENILYEYTKAESERLVKSYKEKLKTVIINPTAVIGPYDSHNSFLGQALRMIYKNKLPMLISGGYNWVDVRDVTTGAITAMNSPNVGSKYILSGHYCSLKELSLLIGKVTGRKTPQWVAPIAFARLAYPFMGLYAKLSGNDPLYTPQSLNILSNSHENISCRKAEIDLNYKSRPLESTLQDTFEWYIKKGVL